MFIGYLLLGINLGVLEVLGDFLREVIEVMLLLVENGQGRFC